MMSDKLKKVVELLTAKTTNKQTIWNNSSSINQFKLLLSQGMAVTIHRWEEQYQERIDYGVTLFNSDGIAIEEFVTEHDTTEENFKLLRNLYKAVTDQYYKVDETLDILLTSLNSPNVIGVKEDTKDDNSIDELPF